MTKHDNSAAEISEPGFSLPELLQGALEFHAAGHFDMARDLYAKVLARDPEHVVALHHLGLIAHANGDHAAAADYISRAVAKQPDYSSALSNLAAVHRATGDFAAGILAAERAIALDPHFAAAHSNLGNIYEDRGEFEAALAAYKDACRIDPHFVEAHANAADLLRRMKRHEEALVICDAIVEKRPDAARPYFCAGNILRELLRASEAMDAFRQAIALQPQFAEAHCNLGNLLLRQGHYEEAIEAYQQAIALNPTIAQTYCNLGAAYELTFRPTEALEAYGKAIARDPKLIAVEAQLYHQRRLTCDWRDIEAAEAQLLSHIQACNDAIPPFTFLSMQTSHADQLKAARRWAASFNRPNRFQHHPPAPQAKRKLKIGYLSSDFYRHATAHLMAELFELHDRTRFEIIGYSHGQLDCSEMRYRLGKAFDALVDLRNFDDREAAQKIHADGIDILIELKGYTQGARSEIAAQRPAPIQVNYLGYPGTMGADFIDYVIADPITLPMDQQPFYDEKIVHLPDCYQPNDTHRRVADLTPSRADCGLPENGFVFCCFNNSYKLTPRFFKIWMRLLASVPGSVLWLFDAHQQVKDHLEDEALKCGIDPARLVFAPRLAPAEHLARHRLADLFLDCLPYNAHTTTSDALWVGLPVLTCIGETFAGRVAASLLNAVGLPELITTSDEDYEAMAHKLATDPELLAGLRKKLQANRLLAPLFDTRRYARHLEAAFTEMWDIWSKGEAPRAFAVTPLPAELPAAPSVSPHQIARTAFAACPLCGATAHSVVLTADASQDPRYRSDLPREIEWHLCRSCGHVHTDGYFKGGVIVSDGAALGDALEENRPIAAAQIARVTRHLSQGLSQPIWLDVGIGHGALLLTAQEFGYEPVGLDTDEAKISGLCRLSIAAHCGTLENYDVSGRFSVISLADMLPRQAFPTAALAAAHRLLRPGGIIFLSMPNRESALFDQLQARGLNPHWSAIDHCHLFTRSRLYRLLRDAGFEPLDYAISVTHKVGMEVIARKLNQV